MQEDHFYLMTVYTGMRRGAGTKSRVSFVLTGTKSRTRVRRLTDGVRVGMVTAYCQYLRLSLQISVRRLTDGVRVCMVTIDCQQ